MNNIRKLKKLLRVVIATLAIAGIVGFLWGMYLDNVRLDKLPRSPIPTAGRIYRDNIHGIVVYETLSEKKFSDRVLYSSFSAFGLSLIISQFYKWKWDEEL